MVPWHLLQATVHPLLPATARLPLLQPVVGLAAGSTAVVAEVEVVAAWHRRRRSTVVCRHRLRTCRPRQADTPRRRAHPRRKHLRRPRLPVVAVVVAAQPSDTC
jgi:hypothetical protein